MTLKLLGIADFAARAGLPYETVRSMRGRGQLPAPDVEVSAGRSHPVYGWSVGTVDAWIAARRQQRPAVQYLRARH